MRSIVSASLLILMFLVIILPTNDFSHFYGISYHEPIGIDDGWVFARSINGTVPPPVGDWVINDVTIVENVELIINGSIIVNTTGALIIRNSTIFLNISANGEHYIDVYGNMTVLNSTIASLDSTKKYYFKVNTNASFLAENSTIRDVGYNSLGVGDKSGLWINTEGAIIRNSHIIGYYGVYLYQANKTIIEGSTLEGTIYSMFMLDSQNNTIANNNILGSLYGVKIKNSPRNSIINNTIRSTWDGLSITSSPNIILANNTFYSSGVIFSGSYNNTVVNNIVNDLPLLYLEGESNLRISGVYGQVILISCSNVTIMNVTVSNTAVGIELWNTNNSLVTDNTVSGSDRGIFLERAYNNTIINNTITGGNKGIALSNTKGNIITLNSISVPYGYGIYGYYGANGNNITLNNVTAYTALYFFEGGNYIYLNNVKGTSPYIAYGSNTLYSPAPLKYVYGNLTLLGPLGNYWSNYGGLDTDGDGIGEEAFNNDLYPLIGRAYIVGELVHIEALIYLWITEPYREYISNNTIIVSWRYVNGTSNPEKFDLYIDNTLFEANITINDTSRVISLEEGIHNITIIAHDASGNIVKYNKNITIDLTPPSIQLKEHNMVTNSRNISIIWNATDNLAGIDHYELYVDGSLVQTIIPSETIAFITLSEGEHEIKIVAYDRAGNKAEDTMVTIIDYTPPTIEVITPKNNTITNASSLTLKWNTSDNLAGVANIEIYLDSTMISTLHPSIDEYTVDLPEGRHIIEIRVIDKAGNTNTTKIRIITDYKPPTLIIISPKNSTTLNQSTIFLLWFSNDTLSGIDHHELVVDGTPINTTIPPYILGYTLKLENGQHTIEIRTIDKAGNIAKAKILITIQEEYTENENIETQTNPWLMIIIPLLILIVVLAIIIKKKK